MPSKAQRELAVPLRWLWGIRGSTMAMASSPCWPRVQPVVRLIGSEVVFVVQQETFLSMRRFCESRFHWMKSLKNPQAPVFRASLAFGAREGVDGHG